MRSGPGAGPQCSPAGPEAGMEGRGPGGREGTAPQGMPHHHPEKMDADARLSAAQIFFVSPNFVVLVAVYCLSIDK